MTVAYSYQIGMCDVCCDKVSQWFDEIRDFVKATNMSWDEDKWFEQLMKSAQKGCALSQTRNPTMNDLQNFFWRALKQGLIVRKLNEPWVPNERSSAVSPASHRSEVS